MQHPAQILKALEGRARKRFGQHFLASEGIVNNIVRLAGVSSGDRVLEIGPGLGVMTEKLLETGAEVVAVELDRDLAAYLRERFPSLTLIEGDAVQQDWAQLGGGGWKCVSNLPYNVGTKLVTEMVTRPQVFDRLVVMLQREVAQRMSAPVGDRKRGSLSVHIEAHATARMAIRVRPGAFHPPPRVESTVLDVTLRQTPLIGRSQARFFGQVVQAGFSAPRKTVRNGLSSLFPRPIVERALVFADVAKNARPAQLSLDEWTRVAEWFQDWQQTDEKR